MVVYAIGSGLIEVLCSPIVEACPFENKSSVMSLLHSFYCWGTVGVVVLSTAFFAVFSIDHWKWLACIWALVPLYNVYNFMTCPIETWLKTKMQWESGDFLRSRCALDSDHSDDMCRGSRTFDGAVGICICGAGGRSAKGNRGSCGTMYVCGDDGNQPSLLWKIRREDESYEIYVFFRDSLSGMLSDGGFVRECSDGLAGCILCGFSVGIMWPGTISISRQLPTGGTAMFALLAMAGDLGGAFGPSLVGNITQRAHDNLHAGMLAGCIFQWFCSFHLLR